MRFSPIGWNDDLWQYIEIILLIAKSQLLIAQFRSLSLIFVFFGQKNYELYTCRTQTDQKKEREVTGTSEKWEVNSEKLRNSVDFIALILSKNFAL